ncbi:MAG: flagellar hook capping FlgD N-terminal domain-containing protein [Zavarzinia sp.]|nr:flagellar hook capping FlgD N-terminal domain-containing protein [Zavarzinia sp.]
MTAVSAPDSTAKSATSATSSSTTSASASLAKNFDTFLTLLTTQLQNQDPLDPMDSNEFTAQLVQFTQVEQAINSNKSLSSMLSLLQGATVTNAVSYIGKEVSVDTPTAAFDGETPVTWNWSNDGTAVATVLTVVDKNGTVVRTLTDTTGTGDGTYTWDGKNTNGDMVDAGTYTLRATSLDKDGNAVSTDITTRAVVTGVENADGTATLVTNSGTVSLDAVSSVYAPG